MALTIHVHNRRLIELFHSLEAAESKIEIGEHKIARIQRKLSRQRFPIRFWTNVQKKKPNRVATVIRRSLPVMAIVPWRMSQKLQAGHRCKYLGNLVRVDNLFTAL